MFLDTYSNQIAYSFIDTSLQIQSVDWTTMKDFAYELWKTS